MGLFSSMGRVEHVRKSHNTFTKSKGGACPASRRRLRRAKICPRGMRLGTQREACWTHLWQHLKNSTQDETPCNTSAGSVVVIILINIDKAHTGRIHLAIGGGREGGGIAEWNVPWEAQHERVEADSWEGELRSIDRGGSAGRDLILCIKVARSAPEGPC